MRSLFGFNALFPYLPMILKDLFALGVPSTQPVLFVFSRAQSRGRELGSLSHLYESSRGLGAQHHQSLGEEKVAWGESGGEVKGRQFFFFFLGGGGRSGNMMLYRWGGDMI